MIIRLLKKRKRLKRERLVKRLYDSPSYLEEHIKHTKLLLVGFAQISGSQIDEHYERLGGEEVTTDLNLTDRSIGKLEKRLLDSDKREWKKIIKRVKTQTKLCTGLESVVNDEDNLDDNIDDCVDNSTECDNSIDNSINSIKTILNTAIDSLLDVPKDTPSSEVQAAINEFTNLLLGIPIKTDEADTRQPSPDEEERITDDVKNEDTEDKEVDDFFGDDELDPWDDLED